MANSPPKGPPHDLNVDDSRRSNGDTETVDSVHEPNRSSIQLHGVGREEDHTCPRSSSNALTITDVLPIEDARERLLYIVANRFIKRHISEVPDSEADCTAQYGKDKLGKRNSREVKFEGDPLCTSPLIYVANIYETLVNEVDVRLPSLDGFLEKTIGVDLESVWGLYRILARKFPEEGPCIFRRREVTCLTEAKRWFPEFMFEKEKEVRFVVVNGLEIVEKPSTLPVDDAEWFKRLTGRTEVSISAEDYMFYSPRHKCQHVSSNPLPSVPNSPEEKLSSSRGNTPPKTPHAQPPSSSIAKSIERKENVKPPNMSEKPYVREVPSFMVPYIIGFYDDFAFGHSGFNAIAEEVGLNYFGGNGWHGVRRDLFLQLTTYSDIYEEVFTSDSIKRILKALSVWTIPADLPEQQFSIPDMGHIVATHYQVAFVVLGQQCITFLPLRLTGIVSDLHELCLVYLHHKKRFISVTLDEDFPSPLPPIHPLWYCHHDSSADGLDRRFADRIQQFEWFQSFMDPPSKS